MLNRALMQEFERIHQEQLQGSLTVSYADHQVRFYFEGGELQLLDFCQSKEILLASQYRAYHKIGPEIEALVVQMHQTQGVTVHDYLRQQQLVTDEEVEQVTRTLVEDRLCDWFGTPSQALSFNAEDDGAGFDTNSQAVRLRIDVPLLLQMVESRLNERDAVQQQISTWDVVFALEEGAPDTTALNDNERHVLHFVDGRKNVEGLASAVRDSSLNTACYLISMTRQGFVRQVVPQAVGHGSGLSQAVPGDHSGMKAAVVPEAAAAPVATAPGLADDRQPTVPVAGPEDEEALPRRTFSPAIQQNNRSKAPMLILLVILVVLAGLGWMVLENRAKQDEVNAIFDECRVAISSKQWEEVDDMMRDIVETAENDPVLQTELKDFQVNVRQQLREELKQIEGIIEKGDLDAADRKLGRMPKTERHYEHLLTQREVGEVRQLRKMFEDAVDSREQETTDLVEAVERDLSVNEVKRALGRLEGRHAEVVAAADKLLRSWRVNKLDEAQNPAMSLQQRRRILEQVKNAEPSPQESGVIARCEVEIQQTDERMGSELAALGKSLERGDYTKVLGALAPWEKIATGTVHAGTITALRSAANDVQMTFSKLEQRALQQLQSGTAKESMAEVIAEIDKRLAAWPELSERGRLESMRKGLDLISKSSAADTIAGEIALLKEGMADASLGNLLKQVFKQRISYLETEEKRFEDDLNSIIDQRQQQGLDSGILALQDYVQRKEVQRAAVKVRAQQQLVTWNKQMEARKQRMEELYDAMLAKDGDRVNALGDELRLSRLPLLIDSQPGKAEVWHNGKRLGQTPYIVKDLSLEAVKQIYQVKLLGYGTVDLAAIDAIGGWRLESILERSAIVDIKVAGPLTSQPAFIEDAIWVAGSSSVVKVDAAGKVTERPIAGGLKDPVYAPLFASEREYFVTTRDKVVVRIDKKTGEMRRQPLVGRSNFPLVHFESEHVLDREFMIVADLDGRLLTSDPQESGYKWRTDKGLPFASGPVRYENVVLCVRSDGQFLMNNIENGYPERVPEPLKAKRVLAVWPVESGIAGMTERSMWSWDAKANQVTTVDLPLNAMHADKGIMITEDWRVHLWQEADQSWQPVGKVPRGQGRITSVTRWNDHAAVVVGQKLHVFGSRAFELVETKGDFTKPVIAGKNLIVVTTNGRVRLFAP